jgi:hypothetical protein
MILTKEQLTMLQKCLQYPDTVDCDLCPLLPMYEKALKENEGIMMVSCDMFIHDAIETALFHIGEGKINE